jgi:SAM-dependent methyltransferase
METENLMYCTVCGKDKFSFREVLWPELVAAWQLLPYEVDYLNRQQGFYCNTCGNNLRSMALADAILRAYSFCGTLDQFVEAEVGRTLKVLEINEAGGLSPTLRRMPNHQFMQYPEYDMTSLECKSESVDLVIHSDTLEHVSGPEVALSECRRILSRDGKCIFTVPIIVDRWTRSRFGLAPSYHGQSGVAEDDQMVHTEFGADAWQSVIRAGFRSCEITSLEYPAALALIARK